MSLTDTLNAIGENSAQSVEFGVEPIPPAVERVMAIKAAHSTSTATSELLRYIRDGQNSESFVFGEDVADLLAEALRLTLEIERPRMARCEVITQAEIDTASSLYLAIEAYQKEWGRAD